MPSARAVDECRPIRATYNLVDSQDSSSTLSFGQFQILTSVQGPTSVQIRQELTDEASLNIQLTPLNGIPNLSYSSFSQDLIGIFKSSILLNHFPRSLLTISSQVLSKPKGKEKSFIIRNSKGKEVQDQEEGKLNVEIKQADDNNGEIFRSSNRCNDSSDPSSPPTPSEKALTINSIQLTLLNSGPVIGSKSTICAISCAVLRKFEIDHERSGNIGWRAGENESSKSDDESLVILIDPSPTEENLALSTHVFAFSFSGRKIGEQPSEKQSKRRRTDNHMEIDGMRLDQDLQIEDDEEEETIGNGEKVELVFNESLGRVEMDLYEELLKKALIGCRQLYEFMRSEMERLHRLP